MNIAAIKSEALERRYQVAILSESGLLVDSCHTLVDLRPLIGEDVLRHFDLFIGMRQAILEIGDNPLHIPMIEFGYGDTSGNFNLEFRRHEDGKHLIWLLGTNSEFNFKLRQIQQERNDSVILLETIQQQQRMLEATNRRLEEVNDGLDRFAYIVSHDLKAPLRAIRNLTTWIAEELEEGYVEELPDQVTLIQNRVGRMERLIEGILSYSRAGKSMAAQGRVDVRRMLTDIFNADFGDRDAAITWPPTLPTFRTAHTALQQVFSNLISNAIKHGSQGQPRLTIHFSENHTADFYEFGVEDAGPGISKKHHERIFEIFSTLQSKDRVESTGIGLAIVKKIVTELGGEVRVVSEQKKGAAFFFTWPKVITEE